MIINVRHTGIVVKDLQESIDFYTDKLGFKIVKRMDEQGDFLNRIIGFDNAEITTVKMSLNEGQMIELLDFKKDKKNIPAPELNETGPTHMAFTVDDLDKTYQVLLQDGIEFVSEPQVSPDSFAKVAFCRAPEGTYIELVELLN